MRSQVVDHGPDGVRINEEALSRWAAIADAVAYLASDGGGTA